MEKSNELLGELKKLYHNKYVSLMDLEEVKQRFCDELLDKDLKKRNLKLIIKLKWISYLKSRKQTRELFKYLYRREKLNQKFIKKEQKKIYQIEGNNLDPQQITAVVACEDAALFLAPAGSGKSASLLAKLNYLTDVLKIPPGDILVIAFTNKVVEELNERVRNTGVEIRMSLPSIRTFHSLGNKILKNKLDGYRLLEEGLERQFFRTGDEEKNALLASVLGLQKSEKVDLEEFKNRLEKIEDYKKRTEALEFYKLYALLAKKYQKYLEKNRMYDFADMLNMATDLVEKMPKGSMNYQYILVDEAQDMSTSKLLLLKAILEKCRKAKLFAVGDDWQSIYRFAGSNLRVLDDFEKIFRRETYRGMIELTYRFGQPTAKISNKFIQRNPHQSRKKVKPFVKRRTPIEVRLSFEEGQQDIPQDYEVVNTRIQKLFLEYGEELFSKKIQIISRYNRDIYRVIKNESNRYKNARLINITEEQTEISWRIEKADKEIVVPFCSMHKAKGITRDIVFVINVNSGKMGMPATRENYPVVETLLAKIDDFPHAEERRLFYVAITRAKEKTILVAEARCISDFVFEVCPKLVGSGVKRCPKCKKGILLEKRRRKNGKIYFKCSNFTGGCRYICN